MSVKGFKLSDGTVVKYDYSSLDNIVTDDTLSVSGTAADAAAVGIELTDIKNDVIDMNTTLSDKVDGAYADEDGYLYLTSNGEVVVGPIGPFAGGGGSGGGSGSGNNAVISATNTTGWILTTLSSEDSCVLSFTWSSLEDDIPTGAGSLSVKVNGGTKLQRSIAQGSISIDITQYLTSGTNNVRLTITDIYGNNKSLAFTINVLNLSISASSFEFSNKTATYNAPVVFNYTPVGAAEKTVYFIIDNGTPDTQIVTATNRQQSYIIPVQEYGSHSFEVYFTVDINGETTSSNHLYYELIFTTGENDQSSPIITSSFNGTSIAQYYTLSIPYRVYTHNQAKSVVSFSATLVDEDDQTTTIDLGTREVDRTEQIFTYLPETQGTLTITMTTGSVSKSFTINVEKSDIDVDPSTTGLELYLNAKGRSNSEPNPDNWIYNDIYCDFSGFNFRSNGWYLDSENSTCLRVSGQSRLTIPFKPFATDWLLTGKTIEFEFETSSVRNYDTVLVSCINNDIGFEITPQSVLLNGSDISITSQYKEEEHVRVSFCIEGKNQNKLIYVYINGIISGVTEYSAETSFVQPLPVNITVGSNDCVIDLYTIRIYNNCLSRDDVLKNWIADTQSGAEMLRRYNRNDILDKQSSIISIDKLPSTLPYLVIESARLSNDKKDKVPCAGRFVDLINSSKSFTFTGATLTVQGTSSQKYPRKNYKIKFKNFVNNNGESSSKYYLRDENTSLPSNVFCFKADYASSEGANNVELVRLYNDACPYKTPPQVDNPVVRQGIDGFPIAIFWTNTTTNETIFIGKYNFNHDKSSGTFGFEDGDESWETTNNSNEWAWFKNADYSTNDWLSGFEARFPDLDDPYADATKLSAMAAWVNSTDREVAPYDIREVNDSDIVFVGGGHPASSAYNTYVEAADGNIRSNLCVVRSPIYKWRLSDLMASPAWDSTNKYLTVNIFNYHIVNINTKYSSYNVSNYACMSRNAKTDAGYHYNTVLNNYFNGNTSGNAAGESGGRNSKLGVEIATTNGFYFEVPVWKDLTDDFYAYWTSSGIGGNPDVFPIGVKSGDIIFAGKNTPYYGKRNINDADIVDFDTPITYENVTYNFDSEDYRLAKFRNELTNWFDRDDTLFYYLFTELFLMVDSRVKNSFPTIYASHEGAKWCWLPYDMDTALGTNNEGEIVFSYNLEDTDGVFNGDESVMWKNVRDAFPKELASLYTSIRSGVINYDEVEQRFEDHQSAWPEALFNEDSYFKYIEPFVENGTNYLYMCVGSKESQRKWWLYNRFRYMDSKYIAGLAKQSTIVARAYQKTNFTATPYADIYVTGSFDSDDFIVSKKATRNEAVTIEAPKNWNPANSDGVLWIYSADQLKSIGGLSGFYLGNLDVSAAIRLQSLEIGSSESGYDNPRLTSLKFGANTLLQYLDVQKCSNLTQTVNLEGCTGIEEIHFEGTRIAGVVLPNACPIKKMYLPDTIVSLSLINQSDLEELNLAGTSNLRRLTIENIDPEIIDGLDLVKDSMVDDAYARNIRLIGFNKIYENDSDFNATWSKIRYSRGLDDGGNTVDYPHLNGTITVNELPRGVYESLSNYPFLTINYSVLGDYAYKMYLENSSKLTTYIDNFITKLKPYAFYNQQSRFTEITCPNVTELGEYALHICLTPNITLGPLTKIGSHGIGRLSSIVANNLDYSHVTEISSEAFNTDGNYANQGVRSELRLPALTTVIVDSPTVFMGYYCSLIDLPSFTFVNGAYKITQITNWFNGASNLTALILRSATMVNLSDHSSTFGSTPIRQAGNYSTVGQGYVYVPSSLVDTYKTDWASKTNLADLVDYIRAIEDYPEICDPEY